MSKKWLKTIAMTLVLGVSLGFGGIGNLSYADNDDDDSDKVVITIPQSDVKALEAVGKELDQKPLQSKDSNVDLGSSSVLFKIDDNKLTFDSSAFAAASEKSAKQNMEEFTNALTNSQVSSETQQYIFDMITGSNPDASVILIPLLMDSTKADIYSAMRIIDPFISFMRVVFGLGAIVIVLLLVTSTIVDLCYIGLPMARGEEDGKPLIPFVSVDAESVVKEIASNVGGGDGKYKNAYILYFKRRALTYIILSICLLYLVAGELGGLISWFLNLASGLV